MIQVICDQQTFEVPAGTLAADIAAKQKNAQSLIGVKINGHVKDLSTPLRDNDQLQFLSFQDSEGREIFLHTSAHLLAQAVLRLWPQAQPTIGPVIDQGFYYDFSNLSISENDFSQIEETVQAIVKERHSVERRSFKNKQEALLFFANNPFKNELIRDFPEDQEISAYSQGEFTDLCRGPHLPNTSFVKAFKLLKTSAAYWKGDPTRESLVRIYGIAFPSNKELKEHMLKLEEAKKRDHRVLATKLDLFSQQEYAPGMPFFHPRGMIVWDWSIGVPELLLLSATIFASFGWTLLRKIEISYSLSVTTINMYAMLFSGGLSLLHSGITETWTPLPVQNAALFITSILLLVIFSNLICYNLYAKLLQKFSSTFLSFCNLVMPLFSAFYGWLLLQETFPLGLIPAVGCMIIGCRLIYHEEFRQGYILS